MAKPMIEQLVSNKQCGTCKEFKLLTDFNLDRNRPGGYSRICRICSRAAWKASHYKRKPPGVARYNGDTLWARDPDEARLDLALRSFRECEPAAKLVASLGFPTIGEVA